MDFTLIYFILNLLYLAVMIVLLLIYFQRQRKLYRVKKWQKSLKLQEHAAIFQQLYQNSNGFILSQQARKDRDALEYVYGEIEFLSFIALLSLAKPNDKTVFYDLGSGIGKAVLACAMVYPVRKSIGVELFPELYRDACTHAEQLATIKNYWEQKNKIEFILGDFLEINFDEATLIFINATSLFGATWEKLCAHLDQLTHLTTIITTSKTLISKNFTVLMSTQVEMSWGVVLAYIHTRKNNIH